MPLTLSWWEADRAYRKSGPRPGQETILACVPIALNTQHPAHNFPRHVCDVMHRNRVLHRYHGLSFRRRGYEWRVTWPEGDTMPEIEQR
jgi:hypothetical protein